jgi:hypothetical protein
MAPQATRLMKRSMSPDSKRRRNFSRRLEATELGGSDYLLELFHVEQLVRSGSLVWPIFLKWA